jgi:hypothetical protein
MEAPIPKETGATRAAGKRTTYCRQQAAECALAATTAILGEVRQAYLNIEQAWLQLAPDINRVSRPAHPIERAPEAQKARGVLAIVEHHGA